MTDREWNRSRDTIAEFFDSDWMHTRIERELARNAELSNKRSEAAKQKLSKRSANAEHLDTQSQSQIPSTSVEAKASTGADAPPEPDPSIAEREFFARGKAVLGKSAGGLLANLLRAKGGNVSLARAALETASTKENPAEYVAAASRGPPLAAGGKPLTQFQKDQQTARNIIDELDSFARGSGRRDEAAAGLLPNYSGK